MLLYRDADNFCRFQLLKGTTMKSKKSKLLNSAILAALAGPAVAMAADAPAAPTLSSVLDASGVSVTGDIDVSYSTLGGNGQFYDPVSKSLTGVNDRVFDYSHNSFTLQAIDIAIAKLPAEGYGGILEVTMGKDASTIASTGTGLGSTQTFDITQGYGQYASGNWTTILGKYNTLAGAEVIKTSGNTNFSRSILFGYAIPFTHTGVRTTYKVSDAVSLIAGLNNGWDMASTTNPPETSQKTIELGAALNPTKSFALTAQFYTGGMMSGTTGATGTRNLLDLVGTFTVTDSLNFVLNYDDATQDNAVATGQAKWNGLAGYVNYQINDPWRISVRGETFHDNDGFRTGVIQTWKEATVTVGYAASKNTELRGEVRKDFSDQASFEFDDGVARKSQSSVALEAVYKF
jgi:hypothetical protein